MKSPSKPQRERDVHRQPPTTEIGHDTKRELLLRLREIRQLLAHPVFKENGR